MPNHSLTFVLIMLTLVHGSLARASDAGVTSKPRLAAAAKKTVKKKKKLKPKKPAAAPVETEAATAVPSSGGITGGEGAPGSIMAAGNVGQVFFNTGFGVEGSYVLMPKLQVGGRYLNTLQKTLGASAQGNAILADVSATSFGGFARYFFLESMPSLFALGGVSYVTASGPYELEVPVPAANQIFYFYSDIKASALLLTGGIGNQWSWGSWVFGADWFSYSLPLSLSSTANPDALTDVDGAPPPQPITDDQKGALNSEIEKKIREGVRFQLLLFHVGYRF